MSGRVGTRIKTRKSSSSMTRGCVCECMVVMVRVRFDWWPSWIQPKVSPYSVHVEHILVVHPHNVPRYCQEHLCLFRGGGQREWVSNRVEYRPCVVPVRTRHSIEWYRVGTWKILLFAFIRKINTKTMEEQWRTVIKLCVCFPNELDVQIKQSLAPTSVSTFNLPSYLLRSSQLGSSGTKISLIRKWILQTSSSASPNACECVCDVQTN